MERTSKRETKSQRDRGRDREIEVAKFAKCLYSKLEWQVLQGLS
jgi:hypothetical protein